MKIEEIEKLLESKKDEKFKLEKEIGELKIKLDIFKEKPPHRVCLECGNDFIYDDELDYVDIRVCSKCFFQI